MPGLFPFVYAFHSRYIVIAYLILLEFHRRIAKTVVFFGRQMAFERRSVRIRVIHLITEAMIFASFSYVTVIFTVTGKLSSSRVQVEPYYFIERVIVLAAYT